MTITCGNLHFAILLEQLSSMTCFYIVEEPLKQERNKGHLAHHCDQPTWNHSYLFHKIFVEQRPTLQCTRGVKHRYIHCLGSGNKGGNDVVNLDDASSQQPLVSYPCSQMYKCRIYKGLQSYKGCITATIY